MKNIILIGLIASSSAFANISEKPVSDRVDTRGANPNMAATSQRASMTYKVGNMDCSGCEARLQNALRKIPGVRAVTASASRGEVSFTTDPSVRVDETAVIRTIENEGFTVTR